GIVKITRYFLPCRFALIQKSYSVPSVQKLQAAAQFFKLVFDIHSPLLPEIELMSNCSIPIPFIYTMSPNVRILCSYE
ncbi:hypothetical protein L9F63_001096, partial [Diploptera punctata]